MSSWQTRVPTWRGWAPSVRASSAGSPRRWTSECTGTGTRWWRASTAHPCSTVGREPSAPVGCVLTCRCGRASTATEMEAAIREATAAGLQATDLGEEDEGERSPGDGRPMSMRQRVSVTKSRRLPDTDDHGRSKMPAWLRGRGVAARRTTADLGTLAGTVDWLEGRRLRAQVGAHSCTPVTVGLVPKWCD